MIETKRCIIKPIHRDDFESHVEACMDPEVVKYTGDRDIATKEEHRKKWDAKLLYMAQNPGFGSFTVFLKSTMKPIGGCNVNQLENTELKHFGYRIYKEFWGQGYATEVAEAVLNYALKKMGLDLITAVCNAENVASQRVLDKIKMNYIGIRQLYNIDLMYYELNRTDYEQL